METMTTERKRTRHSFLRFLLVGLINTAVGLSTTLILLNIFNFSFWYATFIGNGIGTIISYTLNRSYTFGSKATHTKSIILFVIVVLCSYFISYTCGNFLAFYVGLKWITLPYSYVENTAVLIGNGLYTITNYFGQRYFVFKSPYQ
jgi:putative flippase GtrA